jgi:hypothetical protein
MSAKAPVRIYSNVSKVRRLMEEFENYFLGTLNETGNFMYSHADCGCLKNLMCASAPP